MPYGAQVQYHIGKQTAAGSGQAVTDPGSYHHIPFVSCDIGLEKEESLSENLTGRFEQGASYDGASNVAGTLEFEPLPKALGMVLTALIGAPASVTSGSIRTLTYLPRTADYSASVINEPVSIFRKSTEATSGELYFDSQFSQGEFQFAQGQLLRARAVVAAGKRVYGGFGSAGYQPTLDAADLSAGFLWDVASISVGGTGISNLSNITVAINENIEPLYTLNGTLQPYKYTRSGFREVTVQGTMIFDSRSMYNDFIDGTRRQLLITARTTRVQIQSGYYATFVLDVPQMKITQMKPAVNGPGEVSVPFQARGIIDPSSNYTLKATLVNTYGAAY
jgi:hypothetical protein